MEAHILEIPGLVVFGVKCLTANSILENHIYETITLGTKKIYYSDVKVPIDGKTGWYTR